MKLNTFLLLHLGVCIWNEMYLEFYILVLLKYYIPHLGTDEKETHGQLKIKASSWGAKGT